MSDARGDRELLEKVRDFLVKHLADARHSTEWSNQDAAELLHAVQARLASAETDPAGGETERGT